MTSADGNDSSIAKDIWYYMDKRREMLAFLPKNRGTLLDVQFVAVTRPKA
jgi:hypothetical protein